MFWHIIGYHGFGGKMLSSMLNRDWNGWEGFVVRIAGVQDFVRSEKITRKFIQLENKELKQRYKISMP